MQVSRKFEQMDTEALLLRVGAKDPEAARNFNAEASLPGSVPAPEDTASTSNQPAHEEAGNHKFLLEQAVNAKPFVPRNGHKDAEEVRALATGSLFCSGPSLHLVDLASFAIVVAHHPVMRNAFVQEQSVAPQPSAGMSHAEPSSREQVETDADKQAGPSSKEEGKASAAAPDVTSSAEAERQAKGADATPSSSHKSQPVRSSFENSAGPAIR